METLGQWFEQIRQALSLPLFQLGETQVTLWTVIYFVGFLLLLVYLSGWLRWWLVSRLLVRSQLDQGGREALGSIIQYAVLGVGLMVILQTSGVDLTTLNVIAGTVGIGVGFGLQHIANNFISGIIILFERPIKVGDRIEVGNVQGEVVRINARSTMVLTNDNIAIIVPNLKFITDHVVNWSHTGRTVRFRIPVTVAYGSDARQVEALLLEVAREDPDVLDDPAPGVRLLAFGDDGLEFELRAWSTSLIHRRGKLTSNLNFAIYEKFRAHHIEIPSPQRDIRIRSGAIEVKSPT
jgi:small-conductance mechanosensitive channel